MRYPVELSRDDNATVMVRVPDLPGTHTFGEDDEEALMRAVDAVSSMLDALIADGHDIPAPSPPSGRPTVALPALSAAKVELYRAMGEAAVGKAALAGKLGWTVSQIDKLLDLRHRSRLDHVEAALRALGRELEITVSDAA